jgi:hypothetical protein
MSTGPVDGIIEVEVSQPDIDVEVVSPTVQVTSGSPNVAVSTTRPEVKIAAPTAADIEVSATSADIAVTVADVEIVVDVAGQPGPAGPPGPPGMSNAVYSGEWRWTSKTTDANTAGQIGNDGTGWDCAWLHINQQQDDNTDVTVQLALIGTGDYIRVQQKTAGTKWATYKVTGVQQDMGSWWRFPVTLMDFGTVPPNNSTEVVVSLGRIGSGGGTGSGAVRYTHLQSVMSPTWIVEHGLGCHPQVSVEDNAGNQMHGSVTYLDNATLVIGFAYAITGRANCV